MLPEDCPYNIGRITRFLSVSGPGFEASLREYGRKVGRLVVTPGDTRLTQLAPIDEVRLRHYADQLETDSLTLARTLLEHFQTPKYQSTSKTRVKFESKELRKLEKLLDRKECVYRLKGWEPGRWDFLGTKKMETVKIFLENLHPGQVEVIVNRDVFDSPDFKLPY
jgi:hypothetical protein